jgi:threonine dehydrogenase-like Zn-dependent dehydrogenase
MKQVLQHARTGEITVEEVPAPQLLPGCVLVRVAASVVSAGTERASAEFARKSLLQKARSRPDLVREVIGKVQRDGIFSAIQPCAAVSTSRKVPATAAREQSSQSATASPICNPATASLAPALDSPFTRRLRASRDCWWRASPRERSAAERKVPFDEAAFATLGAVALHGIRTPKPNSATWSP